MNQKSKIKAIKCRVCHSKFKVKSTDFDQEIQKCILPECDLRARLDEINTAREFYGISVVVVPTSNMVEVSIEDPIVILVNKHGVETRTLS